MPNNLDMIQEGVIVAGWDAIYFDELIIGINLYDFTYRIYPPIGNMPAYKIDGPGLNEDNHTFASACDRICEHAKSRFA